MKPHQACWVGLLVAGFTAAGAESRPKSAPPPENLARNAKATAYSEYSDQYRARFAIDGRVPECGGMNDLGQAWCVNGATAAGKGELVLSWDRPVQIAEIVYYGRTAWLSEECWKDYEVYLDDSRRPVAKGTFQMAHGPQRIRIAPTSARKVTLRFRSSYGGPNPGALEVEVYAEHLAADALPAPVALSPGRPFILPPANPDLVQLIADCRLGVDRLLFIKRHQINPSHVYTAYCEGFSPGGGIYLLSPVKPNGHVVELLATPKGQVLDLDLSYDGQEILFSWKKDADSGYHVFRMNVDGSGLVQLTDGEWHDYNACWLPDGGVAFVSTRALVFALCFTTPSGVLYRMDRDGKNVRRLSANYVNDFTPSVLPDGRILYTRWEYVDKPAIPIQSLWTMHPDGTNLRVFFGNRVLSPASFLEAKAVPGSQKVLCTMTAHNGPIRGAIGLVDGSIGLNAQEAIINLTPEVDVGRVDRGDGNHVRGPHETPNPLDAARFICSTNGVLMLGEIGAGMAPIYRSPDGLGCYDGTVVAPRPVPPVLTAKDTGVETALPARTEQPTEMYPDAAGVASVYLVDVYRGLEPSVPRGSIRSLLVVEEVAKPLRTDVLGFGFQRPVISCGATYAVKRVWGSVPVSADGSAYFQVPAGRALYFIARDEQGRGVQRMRSFAHFRAGETSGCIGCHEHRNTTPPTFAGLGSLASAPTELTPPPWGVGNFDYSTQVQPVLDRHCTSCHNGRDPQGGIDLAADKTDWFNVSYDVLTRGFVSWIDTRNGNEANILWIEPNAWGAPASKLTGLLLSGHPDATGRKRVQLDAEALERVFTWIDLNVPYYGTYEMEDESLEGGRRRYPAGLDQKLAAVWANRCASYHKDKRPTPGFVRITSPELNPFLLAPLAASAGGRGACKPTVFTSTADPDYQALRTLFDPVEKSLTIKPRIDMPQAQPARVRRSTL